MSDPSTVYRDVTISLAQRNRMQALAHMFGKYAVTDPNALFPMFLARDELNEIIRLWDKSNASEEVTS